MNVRVVSGIVHPLSEPACGQLRTAFHSRAAGHGDRIDLVVPGQAKEMKHRLRRKLQLTCSGLGSEPVQCEWLLRFFFNFCLF